MSEIDLVSTLHKRTKRDYVGRVTEFPKAEAAKVAKQFGKDYWDGDRRYGYGGYRYDGRWRPIAERIAQQYGLARGQRVLDVGCGKAHLLYELTQAVPGLEVAGVDISAYGLADAKEEVRPFLKLANATSLPFEDKSFDLVISLATLHNLYVFDLEKALREIQRVGRKNKYIMVESYRTEEEKANLLYWQLTCESFYTPQEWEWVFQRFGYTGDWSYIFFE
ncbi:MAG: class I SAM-dependent methyltransferase [Planctomycetota bacterium]